MNFNLDVSIFLSFLTINLILGIWSGRGIKNIQEYAVGDRNFSTPTIVATLIATMFGGGNLSIYIGETYNNGLYFFWSAALGDSLCFIVVGIIFAPRLYEFLGKISIAEAMGSMFGERIRVITAICGFICSSGIIAIQFKVSGQLFEYCLGFPSQYGVLLAGIIVTIYSSLGGIKAVTFTDTIQLFTFGTIIPILGYCILTSFNDSSIILHELQTNEIFDVKAVFDFTRWKSIYYAFFFLLWLIPPFNSTTFQRIAMARNVQQVRSSFVISGIACFIICFMIAWIGVLLKASHEVVDTQYVLKYILNKYSTIPGLAGLTLAGVMAMTMSTADSFLNTTSILFVHDFVKPLNIKLIKNELTLSRVVSVIIGLVSIYVGLKAGGLLQIIISTSSYYMAIVTAPFMLAMFGFRSTEKSVFFGMFSGLSTVILWNYIYKIEVIEAAIPGMMANMLGLILSHYLAKQPGGWVGIKDKTYLMQVRYERKMRWRELVNNVKNFSPTEFFQNNSLTEGMYCVFGLYCIISTYSNIHPLSGTLQSNYPLIFNVLYSSVMFIATILLSYPLWIQRWKDSIAITIFWHFTLFSVLICASFLLVIISNFAQLQVLACVINLMIVAILVKWQWAMIMMGTGIFTTIKLFKIYIAKDQLPINLFEVEFKSAYILILISSMIMVFLRPKQVRQQLSDEKNVHLNNRLNVQNIELENALKLRQEFIRNLTHEYHAPMTGIISTSQTLYECYDKLTEFQRIEAAENIYKSSVRLECFDNNIVILSKLAKEGFLGNKSTVNISDLTFKRADACRKLYVKDNSVFEFNYDIEDNLEANIDEHLIATTIDNLVINAITFSNGGKINISLKSTNNGIHFSISDEGIGIPVNELYDIFEPFKVSSKTKTPAGGRGVGLTVAKRSIEAHFGTIEAYSNGFKGAKFIFVIPL